MIFQTSLLVFVLGITALSAPTQGSSDGASLSRFQKTTLALQNAEISTSKNFAVVALTILSEIYFAEIDLALREAEESTTNTKLYSWAAAVESYAELIPLMLDDINAGFPVAISVAERTFTGVTIAGRLVILNHPRADQQSVFENRVLEEFCGRNNCGKLLSQPKALVPIPVSAPAVNLGWNFVDGSGPVCFGGDVHVQFSTASHLARKRSICRQLLQELESLAVELRWQHEQSVVIEWQDIKIEAVSSSSVHVVSLNQQGDVAVLSLPLLNSTKNLWVAVVPWLQAKALSTSVEELRINSDDYSWSYGQIAHGK